MSAMLRLNRVSAVILVAICSACAVPTVATDQFEPRIGQEGKDVIWVPTPPGLIQKMLDAAKVTANDTVIDLGSGDGRTVIAAAKRGATAMGIEYNADMVELSKTNAAKEGVSGKTSFIKADIFESDFSQATVITMYLLPQLNLKLRPKILDLKPGTRIVSHAFTMDDWRPDETISEQDNASYSRTAYLWIVPAKVEGTWKLPQGELTLKQTYQMVTGTLKSGAGSIAISNGRLRGDQITFTAAGANYTGRVAGNTMTGSFKGQWNATRPPKFEPYSGQPGKDVVWVPTAQPMVDKMLDLAKVKAGDVHFDLGSGDGRTVITASKRGAKSTGIEYNPDMVELSKANAAREGATNAVFLKADLFETDFSHATVVTLFLLPDINLKLRPKILDMKPGTRIVSNTFTMGEWKDDETVRVEENQGCSYYCTAHLWIVPAKVAGTWQMAQGELSLKQEFQMLSGTLKIGDKSTAVSNGRMRGDLISFSVGGTEYSGRVAGNSIVGTIKGGGSWNATRR